MHLHKNRAISSIASTAAFVALLIGSVRCAGAGYIVATYTVTSSGTFDNATASYNGYAIGVGTPVGLYSVQNGTGIASGTIDSTGTLTATTDQTSSSTSPDSGTAFAAADLSTGSLKSSLSSAGPNGIRVYSTADYNDVLHFVIPGAGPSTVTGIGVHFSLSGMMSASGAGGYIVSNFGLAQAGMGGGAVNSLIADVASGSYCPGSYTPCIYSQNLGNPGGWASSSFSSNVPGSIVFNGIYGLTGPTADVSISNYLGLQACCGGQNNFDYSHTSLVGLTLPKGVTYTSDSGVFDTVSPSPEPATLALVGFGLLGLAGFARAKK